MKTSYYLLLAAILITLTGMVATDVLLKQEYEKINWADKYQFFARRSLPVAKHVVITGTPDREIFIESAKQPLALVAPADSSFFRFHMQRDTLYVSFNPDTTTHRSPRESVWINRSTGLLLRLPDLQSIGGINARLTMQNRVIPALHVSLQNSLLFATQLTIPAPFQLTERQNSYALLTKGTYEMVRLDVQDSSAVHLADTRIDAFTSTLSDRAEIQFKGQANRWVK